MKQFYIGKRLGIFVKLFFFLILFFNSIFSIAQKVKVINVGTDIFIRGNSEIFIDGDLIHTQEGGEIRNMGKIFITGNIEDQSPEGTTSTDRGFSILFPAGQTGGEIHFKGNQDQIISSKFPISFSTLIIDKSPNTNLILEDNAIEIKSLLKLTKGNLNLNGNDVNLQLTATIEDENNDNRIYGSGVIRLNRLALNPVVSLDNLNGIGLKIKGQSFGNTLIERDHNPREKEAIKPGSGGINRFFTFKPANNNPIEQAEMQYFDKELEGWTKEKEQDLTFWHSRDNAGGSWRSLVRETLADYWVKVNDSDNRIMYDRNGHFGAHITLSPEDCLEEDKPNINLISNKIIDICIGDQDAQINLEESGLIGLEYEWFRDDEKINGQRGAYITIDSENAGKIKYTVKITNQSGCTNQENIEVNVRALPEPNFTHPFINSPQKPVEFTNSTPNRDVYGFEWDFGDDSELHKSKAEKVSKHYTAPGVYSVTLTAKDDIGCSNSISKDVRVHPIPAPAFSFENVCLGAPMTFINESSIQAVAGLSPAISVCTWTIEKHGFVDTKTFGANDGDALSNLIFEDFPGPGTYQVTLMCRSNAGIEESVVHSVVVYPNPEASFTVDADENFCQGKEITLNNNSSINEGEIVKYSWDFGDGESEESEVAEMSHVYENSDKFRIYLTVISDKSCDHTSFQDVEIFSLPNAEFTAVDQCQYLDQTISAAVKKADGYSFEWDMGDGPGPDADAFIKSYASYDDFTITLKVTSGNTGCYNTSTKDIKIFPQPVSHFEVGDVCHNQPSHFKDQSSVPGDGVLDYVLWDLGIGAEGKQTSRFNTDHTYPLPDTYDIIHTVVTTDGCKHTSTGKAVVNPNPYVELPDRVEYCADETVLNADPEGVYAGTGSGFTFDWFRVTDGSDVSVGTSSHLHTVSRADNGIYKVLVTSPHGCTNLASQANATSAVRLFDPVILDLGEPVIACNRHIIEAPLGYSSYRWEDEDGVELTHAEGNLLTVTESGTYYLTVRSHQGCLVTASKVVTINGNPVVSLGEEVNPCNGSPYELDAGNAGFTFRWFDENGSTLATSQKLLVDSDGVYGVEVTNPSTACKAEDMVEVKFIDLPDAGFSYERACLGSETIFTPDAVILGWSYEWTINGEAKFSTPELKYIFDQVDESNVKLEVRAPGGCENSSEQTVEIEPLPVSNFSGINVCHNASTEFSDLSSGKVENVIWDFGDGTGEYAMRFSSSTPHVYAFPGTYTVTHTAISDKGCRHTSAKDVFVLVNPEVSLKDSYSLCANAYTIDADPEKVFSNGFTFRWEKAQGGGFEEVSSEYSSTITIDREKNDNGVYRVWVESSDTKCNNAFTIDAATTTVEFRPLPIPDLGEDIESCEPVTLSAGPGQWYKWYRGEVLLEEETNSELLVTTTGKYKVEVGNAQGCVGVDEVNVWIKAIPDVDLGEDLAVCFGTQVLLNAGNEGADFEWFYQLSSVEGYNHSILEATEPGNYMVKVILNGCSNTGTVNVQFFDLPDAGFTARDFCQAYPTYFAADFENLTYSWDFGDGTTSTDQEIEKIYDEPGIYQVKLMVADDKCAQTHTQLITIHALPIPNFTFSNVCENQAVTFTNATVSGGGNTSYEWNFGDMSESDEENPTKIYEKEGTYEISLSAISGEGCSNAITKEIVVNPIPKLSFGGTISTCGDELLLDANPDGINAGSTYLWSDNSTASTFLVKTDDDYQVEITSAFGCKKIEAVNVELNSIVRVDLGGKVVSCGPLVLDAKNPGSEYVWSTEETSREITVTETGFYRVEIKDLNGCDGEDEVEVIINPTPVVDLGTDIRICDGELVELKAGEQPDGSEYLWTGGNTDEVLVVDKAGVYQLEVTNSFDCKAFDQIKVSVSPRPVADFSFQNVCQGKSIVFRNKSSISSGSLSYEWDFGDGTKALSTNAQKQYLNSGLYEVSLNAISNLGCSSEVIYLTETYPIPVSDFTADAVCVGNPTEFKNQSTVAGGHTISTYQWTFGDGTFSSSQVPGKTFDRAGIYSVSLSVAANGCSHSTAKPVTINGLPRVSLGSDINICGNSWTLDAGNEGSTFLWSDQNTDTQKFTVTESGTYHVSVTSPEGCERTSAPVNVTLRNPVVVNLGEDAVACSNYLLDAENPGSAYLWSSATRNRTFNATQSGSYWVRVTNSELCVGYDTVYVAINPKPEVNLGPDLMVCSNEKVLLDAGNSGVDYLWSDNSTKQTLSVNQSGDYWVRVVNEFGCENTDAIHVNVNPVPVADFTFSSSCFGTATSFSNQASVPSGSLSYLWEFGGGSFANQANPRFVFANAGDHTVRLSVVSDKGCQASATKSVHVNPIPVSDFIAPALCRDQRGSFVNTSAINQGSLTYNWNFGDGSTSTSSNPSKAFDRSGSFNVSLTATSNHGCRNIITKPVTVNALPVVFLGGELSTCDDHVMLDARNEGSTYLWSNNASTQTIKVTRTGTYSVQVTSAQGCKYDESVKVTINNNQKVNLGTDTTVCHSIVLDAGKGSVFNWSTGARTQTIKALATGNYSVTVISSNLCSSTDDINVVVNPLPVVSLGADRRACEGETVVLDPGNVGVAYLWSDQSTNQSLGVTQSGSYQVEVTNEHGCKDKSSVKITYSPLPVVNLGADRTVCGSVVLDAQNAGAGASYLWSDGSTQQKLTARQSGNYWVKVTSALNCSKQDDVQITVNSLPVVDLGPAVSLCNGEELVLDAGNPGSTYLWSNNSTQSTMRVAATGKYWVEVTDQNGCKNRGERNVSVHPLPIVNLGADRFFCDGSRLVLDAENPGATYRWGSNKGTSATTKTLLVNEIGTYWVKVTTSFGCTASDTVQVKATNNPLTASFLSASIADLGEPIQFVQLSYPDPTHFHWRFGDGVTSTKSDPVHVYYMPGDFNVRLIARNEVCADTLTKIITIRSLRVEEPEEPGLPPVVYKPFVPTEIVEASAYPNPNDGKFNFKLKLNKEERAYIGIYNLNGILVEERVVYGQELLEEFDISRQRSAMYFLKVYTGKKVQVMRIIKF
jgi:PKD repeat protein